MRLSISLAFVLGAALPALPAQDSVAPRPAPEWPGPRPDGSILLPNGWSVRPYGRQIELGSDLPIRTVWHPGGRWLAVQHVGYRAHQVSIVDAADGDTQGAVVATLPLPRSWSGMAFTADGARLLVSGGVDDVVHAFAFDAATGRAEPEPAAIVVGDPNELDLVAGMAVSAGQLFVCLQRSDRVAVVDLATGATLRTLQLDAQSFPCECVPVRGGTALAVSVWGRSELVVFDLESGAIAYRIATGEHPCELCATPDGDRLFVGNANENTVSVIDLGRMRVEETLCSALFPVAPPGSTPNSVALSPDGETLLVANADNNNCAVFDVADRGRARSLGFVPLGLYPTSIRFSLDGSRIWVANGKGSVGSRANPDGPQPERGRPDRTVDYVGALYGGSLSTFPVPAPEELRRATALAYDCSPLHPASAVRGLAERPTDSPIPAKVGDPSPIRHCIYVIKENRTYDQVFGDLPQGNGDASLCLFPRDVTPNHHAIAETFLLLDNFYVESEVSADGHEWTMGGYATDFVERTWPVTYGGKGTGRLGDGGRESLGYPSEGGFEIAAPKGRYLFDLCAAHGVPFRSYGEFVANGPTPADPGRPRIPVLEGNFDPYFRSFDTDYLDIDRAARFLAELARFEATGAMPRLIVLRLPNDHTAGTGNGKLTPRAMVADNDLALGRVLEALSRSSFWTSTAVFVVEDDAQNGPDHVDAHRTVALVAGAHVRRGAVVSVLYSTCSMLRTMELILGLPPMSQFDAAARPMFECFQAVADPTPYEHRPATWNLEERNGRTAYGGGESATFDWTREDAVDDLRLNELIWRSIRGPDAPLPVPRRAAFVRALDADD
ncbi:MAG: phosphoesterase [Planctomycetes bacterium]|nr:phosphoesterase [Planctomycetota bacterium]